MSWMDRLSNWLLGRIGRKVLEERTARARRDSDRIESAERRQYLACVDNQRAHEELQAEQEKSVGLIRRAMQKLPTQKLPPLDEPGEMAYEESDETGEMPPVVYHGG